MRTTNGAVLTDSFRIVAILPLLWKLALVGSEGDVIPDCPAIPEPDHEGLKNMQALELKIPPPVVAALVGVGMWMAAYLLPPVHLTGQLRLMIAGVCAVFGLIIAGLGFWAFRQAKTTVNPVTPEAASSVVTGGVYSYTRNPMYLGLTAVLVGWAVWLSVPWVFLGPVAFMLFITRFQIIPEERVMSSKFGRDYDEYRKRVRRWL